MALRTKKINDISHNSRPLILFQIFIVCLYSVISALIISFNLSWLSGKSVSHNM